MTVKASSETDTHTASYPAELALDAARNEARQRTDDVGRDYVAAENGRLAAPATSPDTLTVAHADRDVNRHLSHLLERSAQSLRHAAESIESRGLKVLLKVMAQERVYMYNTLRQAIGQSMGDPFAEEEMSPALSVEAGMQDLQSSMTVKQQGRENVTLKYLLGEEEKLLDAYTAAIDDGPPVTMREVVQAQRAQIAQFNTRLRAVQEGVEPIVARVFDTRIEGDSAVTRLRAQGLTAAQIDVALINQVAQPVLSATEGHLTAKNSLQNTMVAGALIGALCGGIFGLVLAAFVWFAPQSVTWVAVPAWQLLVGSIVAGAVGGTVFGFFIGQNQREIDYSLTEDSLINGEVLVVAYPQPQQVATAEVPRAELPRATLVIPIQLG